MAATVTTITGLVPTIYEAFNVVAGERADMQRAVSTDGSPERAAVNQTIRSPVVGAMAAENLEVNNVASSAPDQTIDYVDMSITKARSVPFGITGEESLGLGSALSTINRDRIAQALRTLRNEVEADLTALHIYASRAYGTYNTTPFGTADDLSDFAQPLRILEENGAPASDLHMVLGGTAIANLRGKQSSLFKVNEAGSDALLRTGALGEVMGFNIHNSGQVKTAVTVGTNNGSATTDATGYAVGTTEITMADAGTGTIIPGDIITFAGDTNKYLVVQGDANVAAGAGTLIIAEPGLKVAMSAATKVITTVAATTRNMFFQRSAIQLATRAPAMPEGGDAADDVMIIQDPVSGIAYEFCVYKQKRQVRWEVNLAWGVKMIKPEFAGVLIGA